MKSSTIRRLSILLIGAAAACSEVSGPEPRTPAVVAGLDASGSTQVATVGSAVPADPTVIVKDSEGQAVPGAVVTFAVVTGGGSVARASATTDESGIATAGTWTLGTAAGEQTLRASVGQLSFTFTAIATAGAPAVLAAASAGPYDTAAGEPVATKPAVLVHDAHGNPIPDLLVTFAVTAGGGSVSPASVTTDAAGTARVGDWRLGTVAGENEVAASVQGLPAVLFKATGAVGAPAVVQKIAGDTQTAAVNAAVAVAPQVRVTDAHGNAAAGIAVVFAVASGGGTITDAEQTTDAQGHATLGGWVLGAVGENAITAAVSGVAPVTFIATGLDPCTAPAISLGEIVSGTLGPSSCVLGESRRVALHTLTITEQTTVELNAETPGWCLCVYDQDNEFIVGIPSGTTNLTLAPGTYGVRVDSKSLTAEGPWTFSTRVVPFGQAYRCWNHSVSFGVTITNDLSGNCPWFPPGGGLVDNTRQTDSYQRYAYSGTTVRVNVTSGVPVQIELRASGATMASSPIGTQVSLEYAVSQSGYYEFMVVGTAGKPYTITIQR